MQTILRNNHPELLAELEAAGVVRGSLDELLPRSYRGRWQPDASDEDFRHLCGRRATLEYVLRRHVERTGQVEFLHDSNVEELLFDGSSSELRAVGAVIRQAGVSTRIEAEVVIDALGVRSRAVQWLEQAGAKIPVDASKSQVGYFCRHFTQSSPDPEPVREDLAFDLNYLLGGVFFGEDNTFSIALTCPESETELLDTLRRPDGFDQVCAQVPSIARWRERGQPISRVMGGANLQNRWYRYDARSARCLGFFPLGDSFIQSNPVYGRGCCLAFIQAEQLAKALAHSPDAQTRATVYYRKVWQQLRPYFNLCRAADEAVLARSRSVRGEPLPLRDRVLTQYFERAFTPALEESRLLVRQWLSVHHTGEPSGAMMGLFVLLYTNWLWLLRSLRGSERANAAATSGPSRSEMLQACEPFTRA
jgi:2-polyprenyl-6-methoxyphenol hydroxylase-like FAD-dependent oxidoreductase